MPSWKKIITSGSDATLNSLNVATSLTASIISGSSLTGSLFGTSSWAQNALTASFVNTSSTNAFVQNGNSFGATAVLGTNDNNSLGLETNGSTRLFISSSGNVGIGTNNPTTPLTIISESNGNYLNLRGGSNRGLLFFDSAVNGGTIIQQNGDLILNNDSTARGIFFNNAGVSVRTAIFSTGNVAIGTNATPTSRLQVRGSGATSATTALLIENSSATARLTILDDGTSAFNTSHLYVSSSGRIGIGTSTPSTQLHISGASNSGLFEIDSPAQNNIIYVSGSGNVGIGTGTPSARLHINGDTILSGSLYTYGANSDIDSGSLRTVLSVSTGSYRAAFFDYVLTSGSNARAGTVFSVWQGTSVEYADTSTNDIGNTSGVNLLVSMSGANIGLFASSSNDNWSMKALARLL